MSKHARLRDEQGEGQVVRFPRDVGQTLRLEGREDRRGLRAAEEIAVVIAPAAAETLSFSVKARAGDKHGVKLLRRETERSLRLRLRTFLLKQPERF